MDAKGAPRRRQRNATQSTCVGMVSCILLLKVCVLLPACFHRHLCSIHIVSSFFFSFRFSRVSLTTTLGSTRIEDSPRRSRFVPPIQIRQTKTSQDRNIPLCRRKKLLK